MKKKVVLALILNTALLCQTTYALDCITGAYIVYGAYTFVGQLLTIKNNFLERERKFNERMKITGLFFISDADVRFQRVTEYFSENPEKIHEKSAHLFFPQAGAYTPLYAAQIIEDKKLIAWFKEQGA